MRCPECEQDALEPIYAVMPSWIMDDHPLRRGLPPPVRKQLRMLLCASCKMYYLAYGGETAAQTYRRIQREFGKGQAGDPPDDDW